MQETCIHPCIVRIQHVSQTVLCYNYTNIYIYIYTCIYIIILYNIIIIFQTIFLIAKTQLHCSLIMFEIVGLQTNFLYLLLQHFLLYKLLSIICMRQYMLFAFLSYINTSHVESSIFCPSSTISFNLCLSIKTVWNQGSLVYITI